MATNERAQPNPGRDGLLADLRRLADDLGHPPTSGQYATHGDHARSSIYYHFDGWQAAIEAAGLSFEAIPERRGVSGGNPRIPSKELCAELRAGYEALGFAPRRADVDAFSEYQSSVFVKRFGSWLAALEAADVPVSDRRRQQLEAAQAGAGFDGETDE